MEQEYAPQPETPENTVIETSVAETADTRSPEEIAEDAELSLEWAKNSFKMWNVIKQNEMPTLPDNAAEAQTYIRQLDYLKTNLAAHHADDQGKEFYTRIDNYIAQLKKIGAN